MSHRWLVALCFTIASGARPAAGQDGGFIDLSWHDCVTQPGAAANPSYACDGSRDGVPFRLVLSFVAPDDLPQFVGVQATLRMRSADLQWLPDWWQLGVGECRAERLAFPSPLSGVGTGTTGACQDPWTGNTGGGFLWESNERDGFPSPGWGTLRIAWARDTETALARGQRYVAGVVTLDPEDGHGPGDRTSIRRFRRHAAPQGSQADRDDCHGCALPACLALWTIELYQTAGAPGGDVFVLTRSQTRLFVTWQGGDIGGSGCPAEVPVRNRTWGAIKAIYR